ncbi:hypothetical protein CR203_03730 [Salipaludibacillus neizhouensis]|uniref:Uncharacterized protein n=1 Tax=Salipaludibacillus neizhouensis TaxID=885475 RepID=A0A3A9KF17_9BACI|nr:hypothetical protein [Salipaludibacillus neizhouensis]RKL69152.1 hypothetical protein CR203_03730 [Salipaludibacillus neizhouensis]
MTEQFNNFEIVAKDAHLKEGKHREPALLLSSNIVKTNMYQMKWGEISEYFLDHHFENESDFAERKAKYESRKMGEVTI